MSRCLHPLLFSADAVQAIGLDGLAAIIVTRHPDSWLTWELLHSHPSPFLIGPEYGDLQQETWWCCIRLWDSPRLHSRN